MATAFWQAHGGQKSTQDDQDVEDKKYLCIQILIEGALPGLLLPNTEANHNTYQDKNNNRLRMKVFVHSSLSSVIAWKLLIQ